MKHTRRNHDEQTHLFRDKYHYTGKYKVPTTIRLVRYGPEKFEMEEVSTDTEDYNRLVDPDAMNWFRVSGLTNADALNRLMESLDCYPVDAKAMFTPYHVARIDETDRRLLIVMDSCVFERNETVTSEHVCIYASRNVVITFRERDVSSFDYVFRMVKADTMNLRTAGNGMLVAFILNSLLSEIVGTSLKVENMLEKLDDTLLDAETKESKVHGARRLESCRHATLILQKNITPLHAEFQKLFDADMVMQDDNLRSVFVELYNQLDYIMVTMKNSREMLSSMRDLYVSSNDFHTNAIMQRLTVVSTLFIPITFLVGLWGMNFVNMPEISWWLGYPFALAILLLTVFFTWRYMKKNDWF